MKLRVASDLHFDHHADAGATIARELAHGDFDILVVAGDLSDFHGFAAAVTFLCAAVASRPVLYVLGNHEGYGGRWLHARSEAVRLGRTISNLTFLEQSLAVIEGQRFVGCTLWYPHSGGARAPGRGDPGFCPYPRRAGAFAARGASVGSVPARHGAGG